MNRAMMGNLTAKHLIDQQYPPPCQGGADPILVTEDGQKVRSTGIPKSASGQYVSKPGDVGHVSDTRVVPSAVRRSGGRSAPQAKVRRVSQACGSVIVVTEDGRAVKITGIPLPSSEETLAEFILANASDQTLLDELARREIRRFEIFPKSAYRDSIDKAGCKIALNALRKSSGDGEVYVIRPAGLDFVKIGSSAKTSAQRRLDTLQTAWPVPLELMVSVTGVSGQAEFDIQKCFRAHCIRGEWFRYSKTIAFFIEGCKRLVEERKAEWFDTYGLTPDLQETQIAGGAA